MNTEIFGGKMATELSYQASILAEMWISKRSEEEHAEFMAYYDLGLPLAYAYAEDLVELTPEAVELISETFRGFLQHLDVPDLGYTDLSELLDSEDEDLEEESITSDPSDADELAKWHKLFISGVITEDEFVIKKRQILGI